MGKRVLVLDNFDSFTWNVVHALVSAGASVEVFRADRATLHDIEAFGPDLLVISPGPRRPEDAVLSLEAIRRFSGRVPILGICLGHQCIAVAFGGEVGRSPEPVHGKVSEVEHDGTGVFTGLASPLPVGRYHSLAVVSPPPGFVVNARTGGEGIVMGLRHPELPIAGLQFHPDSFLTPEGEAMFENALNGNI